MKVNASQNRKGMKVVGVQLIVTGLVVASAHGTTYPDATIIGPSSQPTFPAAFEAFVPPVHSDPVSGDAPAIAEWTRSNNPGDTMALTGEMLGANFVFYTEGVISPGTVRLLDGRQCAVTLPSNLDADAFCLMWNQNDAGYGKPVRINGTEAWWVGPNKVATGETFSIFGQSLNPRGECYAYIEGYGWLTSSASNPYKANFVVPSDLANGTYTVWAHNGQGKGYGWGESHTLEVYDGFPWDENTANWYDVTKAPYNADNTGVSDVTAAIEQAISDANGTDWTTVYLPAGTYAALTEIDGSTMTKVRIKGAGKDSTFITELGGGISIGECIVDIAFDDSEMCDLTIQSSSDNTSFSPQILRSEQSDNAVFRNVRISQRYPETGFSEEQPNGTIQRGNIADIVRGHNSTRIRWYDCEFLVRKPILMVDTPQLFFDGCDFYGLDDANTILSIKAGNGVSIENCTARNFDDSDINNQWGWSNGRWVYSYPTDGSPNNWYFANNITTNLTQRSALNYQNTGEDFMFERCEIKFIETPTAVSASTITFADLPTKTLNDRDIDYVDYTITVMDGKGFAQSRRITAVDFGTNVLTIDKPWKVIPDTDSILAVNLLASQIVCYNNSFDGTPYPGEGLDKTAETGIQAYGGVTRLIADGNTSHEQETAFYVYSNTRALAITATNNPTPNYFNVYKNNTADTCYHLARVMVAVPHDYEHLPSDNYAAMFGNVYRKNHATNISGAVWSLEWDMAYPHHQMGIYEGNTADNYADDIVFFDKEAGTSSDTQPSVIMNQVVIDEYVNEPSSPPPPDPPPAPVLTGIVISGPSSMDEEATAQYLCTASYSDGTTAAVAATWSENSAYASISAAGVLTAGNVSADQSATVTASFGGLTDTYTVTIKYVEPVLSGIVVSGSSSVYEETTAQYVCTANYSDGTSVVVTPSWSENSSYATISGSGVLTAGNVTANKSLTITASYGGKTDTHSVTIQYVAPVLTGIVISGSSSVNEGTTAQYVCTASYSDGTTGVVTPAWSENSSYATINSSGVLTAGNVTANKSLTITASFGGKTDTHAVTITYVAPVLAGITVSGPSIVDEESTAQYICTASYSDGTSAVVTPGWSENSSSTTISSSGVLTVGNVSADQTVTLTASYGGKTDTHSVTIKYVPPVLTGITISGPSSVDEEATAQYVCTASYSDGTSKVVVPGWSENSASATISSTGLLTAEDVSSDQTVTISASFGGKSDTHSATIKYVAPVLTGITVSGPSIVDEESTAQYACTASYSDGTSKVVVPGWSENSSYATISSSGVLTTGNVSADQTVTLTASYGGKSDTHSVSIKFVAPLVVVESLVIAGSGSMEENTTAQYVCTAHYSDGTSGEVEPVWSDNSAQASISGSGLLAANNVSADASVTITASFAGKIATKVLEVVMVGDQVVLPLSGFDGKTVLAELWDQTAEQWVSLGEDFEPTELVIENVTEDQWYWVGLSEYNEDAANWVLVHGRWFRM